MDVEALKEVAVPHHVALPTTLVLWVRVVQVHLRREVLRQLLGGVGAWCEWYE